MWKEYAVRIKRWWVGMLSLSLFLGGSGAPRPVLSAIGAQSNSGTVAWQEELVVGSGETAAGVDFEIDGLDGRHLAFVDAATHELRYAYAEKSGAAWTITTLATDVTGPVALAVGIDRRPRIAFVRDRDLYYVERNASGNDAVELLSRGGAVGGLAMAWSEVGPHIVFGTTSTTMSYARLNLGHWQVETIPLPASASVPGEPDIVVDYANQAHIAVNRGGTVYYGRISMGIWQFANLGPGDAPTIAIAADTQDGVHVVFRSGTQVFHHWWAGTLWESEAVGTLGPSSYDTRRPGLAVDSLQRPHVSYVSNGAVQVVVRINGAWAAESASVFHHGAQGSRVPLRIDSLDEPHVAFRTAPDGDVYHAALEPGWALDQIDYGLGLGATSVAAPRNGVPRISYAALTGPARGLRYAVEGQTCAPPSCYQTWVKTTVAAGETGQRGLDNTIVLRTATDGGDARIASYNPISHTLEYSYQTGALWTTETVDASGDVGRYAQLALDDTGTPYIAYWDATNSRIKLAWKTSAGWQNTSDLAGPALNTASGSLSLALTPSTGSHCCAVYVSYYDAVNQDLRIAVWSGAVWQDYLIDSSGDVGRINALAYWQHAGDGFLVAYTDDTHQAVVTAHGLGAVWTFEAGLQGTGAISDLSPLWADAYQAEHRFAYATNAGALVLADYAPISGGWVTTTVESGVATTLGHLGLSVGGGRVHLTYTRDDFELIHAVSGSTLSALYYNPLQPCTDTPNTPARFAEWSAAFTPPSPETPPLEDLDTLRVLRDLFATSPGGQHFIDLYYAQAAETGALALADPALALQAYALLQDFLPGFEALVRGHGADVTVTAELVARTNALLDDLAASGSPALAAALAAERARFNQLHDFEGISFSAAAEALGVTPPVVVYLPQLGR